MKRNLFFWESKPPGSGSVEYEDGGKERERSRVRKVPAKVRRTERRRSGIEYASRCGVDDRSPDNVESDGGGDDAEDIEPDDSRTVWHRQRP